MHTKPDYACFECRKTNTVQYCTERVNSKEENIKKMTNNTGL